MLRKVKGQNTLEYAIIIVMVVGALLAMQTYMKRGVEGKMRETTDGIGDQFDVESAVIDHTVTSTRTSTDTIKGGVTTSIIDETAAEAGSHTLETW